MRTKLYPHQLENSHEYRSGQIGHYFQEQEKTPDLDELQIAFIGVGVQNPFGANGVRKQLYNMYMPGKLRMADLGDFVFVKENEVEILDLAEVVKQLLQHNVQVLLFGGNALGWKSVYRAYEMLGWPVNFAEVNSSIDSSPGQLGFLMQEDGFLANLHCLGYQAYFTHPQVVKELHNRHYECLRLGELKADLRECEPTLRDKQIVSFHASAIQQAFIKAENQEHPNGFTGEEACGISRYAAMAANLGAFVLHSFEQGHAMSQMQVAQMLWYFLEGQAFKRDENPLQQPARFTKYITDMDTHTPYHLVFFKSRDTEKWWMHIPVENPERYHLSQYLIPCSYRDYTIAQNGEIPDKWLQAVSRLGQ